ncbi:MAG TPA: hypothetical protein VGE01_14675, partial [Fimbriimonas sp.]
GRRGQGEEESQGANQKATRSRIVLHYRLAKSEENWFEKKKLHVEERILDLLGRGWALTTDEIARRPSIHPGTARHAVKTLTSDGAIAASRAPKSKTRYALPDSEDIAA